MHTLQRELSYLHNLKQAFRQYENFLLQYCSAGKKRQTKGKAQLGAKKKKLKVYEIPKPTQNWNIPQKFPYDLASRPRLELGI